MNKHLKSLVFSGVLASAVLMSCKSNESVVTYDSQTSQGTVYRSENKVRRQNQNQETGYTRYYTKPVDNTITQVRETSSYQVEEIASNRRNPNAGNSEQVVIRTITRSEEPVQSTYSNNVQPVQVAAPAAYTNAPEYYASETTQPQQNNFSPEYISMSGSTARNQSNYNGPQHQPIQRGRISGYDLYNRPASSNGYAAGAGRNRALDNNLANRPNSYTLSQDMYTPEYRAMMAQNQSSQYNTQQPQQRRNTSYEGLMTVTETGDVVPYVYVEPAPVQQPQQCSYQQQYQQPQVQNYSQPQTNVQVVENYKATLVFANGAKLSGTIVRRDNSIIDFRMAGGREISFSASDVVRVERW